MESEETARQAAELEAIKARLRPAIHWRDILASQLAKVDAEIAADARVFADLSGEKVKPKLEQLRRMLGDENGKG